MAQLEHVATEFQLLSAGQRFLQVIFGPPQVVTRGDGCVLFEFPPLVDGEDELSSELQRLCAALVRDVTGRTAIKFFGEDHETDVASLKARVVSFTEFIADAANVEALQTESELFSTNPNVWQMLEVLYLDVVGEMGKGMRVVTKFPKLMCPTGSRWDIVLSRAVCIQAYSNTAKEIMSIKTTQEIASSESASSHQKNCNRLKVWINLRALANAVSFYAVTSIEGELPQQWQQKTFTLSEASEVLNHVHMALNSFWNRGPRNERTKANATSLLFIVSSDIREYIKGQILLEGSDWRTPWRINVEQLEKALELIEKWNMVTRVLVEKEWTGWDGGPFHDKTLDTFAGRLRDVIYIRQLLESTSKLLKGSLQSTILPEVLFEGESLMDSNETLSERWEECKGKFKKEFEFLESNLRGRLKQLITGTQQELSDATIRLLQQHKTLLQVEGIREGIQKELQGVRSFFLQQIEKARGRYENKRRRATTDLRLLHILRSCQAECAQVAESAAKLFGSSEALDEVVNAARSVIHEVGRGEEEVITSWKQNIDTQCKKIMELANAFAISCVEKDYVVCTLNPLIKQFVQEIHNMRRWWGSASGYKNSAASNGYLTGGSSSNSNGDENSGRSYRKPFFLSNDTENVLNMCERLITAAARNTQVVGNYITVQQQILRCTRPMLETALANAHHQLFYSGMESRVISVANYHELEGLNTRFQNAVEILSNDNRRIRRFHCDFLSQVVSLHNVDLAKHMDQWRSAVDNMRSSFEEFLRNHRFEHYDNWRRHLDAQIYKALEHQYQRGLESLHEKMEEFKVEIVFKQGQIQFKPSFEAMREAYYAKLREFVSVPLRFRGLQQKRESGVESYEMYRAMLLANSNRLVTVHTKAVNLFLRLTNMRKAFRAHMVVGFCGVDGAPDIDTVVEEVCKTLPQFVDGFNVVREQMRKLQRIENSIVIDCFTVSTIPVKASMEEQLHRLEELLINTMRKMMQRTLADIDDFVFNASNIITRQPMTMDEVGHANKAYHEFLEAIPFYEAKFAEVGEMNRVLRQQSDTFTDLSATKSRLEHLREAMSSHSKIIDASVSKMRFSLDNMIQKHLKDVQRFVNKWEKEKQQLILAFKENNTKKIQKSLVILKDEFKAIEELKTQGADLQAKCDYFKLKSPNFEQSYLIAEDVTRTASMWNLYDTFYESLDVLRKEDWLTFRTHTYLFEDFIKEWREKLMTDMNCKIVNIDTSSGSGSAVIVEYLQNLLDEWSLCIPLLRFVRGDGMMTEHWNEMFRLLEIEKGTKSDELTFADILDHHRQIVAKETELKQLYSRAQGEVQIRDALQDLRAWALEATFTLITPTDTTTPGKVKLITDWKDVMTQVSENQALICSLKDSLYFHHFADGINGWEVKLTTLSEALGLLNTIQQKWTYLEPVFAKGALPQEQGRFKRVDKEFVSFLRAIEADPRVMSVITHTDILERLKNILEQIERCQKSLVEFLETKRSSFPRFYFISDEDMLEILGHSKNPLVIQMHLKKLFMGIHSVAFSADEKMITYILSSDREKVQMSESISINVDDVEKWLSCLDIGMRNTLKSLIVDFLKVGDFTLLEVLEAFPSQILQVAQQIQFTADAEKAIEHKGLEELRKRMHSRLYFFTQISAGANHVLLLKIKALILDVIHHINVLDLLIAKRVEFVASWWWQKQLRYYLQEDSQCVVFMLDTSFLYTYEYQGNAPKLVYTPLTDKCFLVLTKGMGLGYGGNPYGPAGTGKTESVKALGSALGRQVLVFNCDEGIDFKAMGRIFIGIVKCGAWGCFDEFNRLKIGQLSAISQMIQIIQEAIKKRESSCVLLGRTVNVDRNAGIFVTLNPAGKGYGGRTKLPDNLKQLFREVAMTVPDNELIISTMLLSEGFTHTNILSKKIVELYSLFKQLMSKQQHYDWGLRSLKSVLCLAGTLMHKWKMDNHGKLATEEQESELIVQSLSTNTLSKLTPSDVLIFRGLTADIFPQIAVCDISNGELKSAIEIALKELKLQVIPEQVSKAIQFYSAISQRMGVVLVGPSGSGKSTLLRVVRRALQLLSIEVPLYTVNPKAVPRQQLLGYMDPDTREWHDGIISSAARNAVKHPRQHRPWILCDGDIDPEWIESLNSVLDDNRLLTFPNGVRIQFEKNVNFIFETYSLAYASPATVSRMGVILFSAKDISFECAVKSILEKQTQESCDLLAPLIKKYLIFAVKKSLELDALLLPTTPMGFLNSCLAHVMHAINEEDFVLSLIRGLFVMLHPSAAQTIASLLYEHSRLNPISSTRLFDTYYDREKKRIAEFTADLRLDGITPETLFNNEAVVYTIDAQRLFATLQPLVTDSFCRSFFLVGPEGCGKSITLRRCFARYSGIKTTVLHCSAQTTSAHLIHILEQLCVISSTNTGRIYRPKEGERLVVILKNINLAKPDKYGTVELHALFLQLIMYHGFFNKDLEWVDVEKIQFVASMNLTTSAGCYPVSPRLLSSVCTVFMTYPSHTGLMQIYNAYFSLLLRSTTLGHGTEFNDGSGFAQFLIYVYEKIRGRFGGDEYIHCSFSPRSITKCVTNLLMYAIDQQTTTLPAVLAHECACIFADCLLGVDDRKKAEKIISELLATIGYSLPSKDRATPPIMFVSWFSEADNRGIKLLKGVPYEMVVTEVEHALVKYSREFKELNIHIIPETLAWIARIDRVLARSAGHLILIGRPGVGRRNAVHLVAYMLRMQVVRLNMMLGYNIKNFRQDLRQYVQKATLQNERMVLLLDEHNIVDESFLEMINSMVSSGEVPGLFTPEELETMFASLRDEASNEGYIGTLYAFFLSRLRRNLHVVMLMDNYHPLFLLRLQSNPGLLSNCDVLWMGAWSNNATRAICKEGLKEIIKEIEAEPNNRGFSLHRELFAVHEAFEDKATPARFQIFMANYKAVFLSKSKSSGLDLKRLEAGLAKLHDAEENIAKIQCDVKRKKEQVEEMQCEADKALAQIQRKMEESKEQRDSVKELQERLKDEHEEILVKRQKVEDELSVIKPSLESAREAVSSIRNEQLNEIRSLKAPPEPVRDVLEGVLALLGVNDVSWQSMRKFLGERGMNERIIGFNAEKIPPAIRENVTRLLNQKALSFKQEVIYRASVAAAPMAAWVKATVEYATILERIAPLNSKLRQLEVNQKNGEEQLSVLKEKLKHIDVAVEELRQEFSDSCREAERLKNVLEKAEAELLKACELLDKLIGEKTRWAEDIEKIRANNRLLPKRALIAAAFMTYITKATEDVRQRYFKQWSDRLSFESVVSVTSFMRTEGELLQWKTEGLPGDQLSQENAIAILDSVQTPLVIDPANQAVEWVKVNFNNNNVIVEVISVLDERFAHTLELAIRFGKTLLVTDVDGIEPILYPILRRDMISVGPKRVVHVGTKLVDWQDTFRIMLFTRRTDLELPPGAAALVLEVNFSVTRFGLQNQLLGITIQHERPELEQQRVELLQKEEGLILELNKLEERLLNDLANSHGNLLENTALVSALNDVKLQSLCITEALQQSHALQLELDKKRDVYRLFASKGAAIYFLIKDMAKLNRMYQFGLQAFIELFLDCLKSCNSESDIKQKISMLTISFAQKCFFYVSLGLLAHDRLAFGMHLVQGFCSDLFPSQLWSVFVGAANNSTPSTTPATTTAGSGEANISGDAMEFPLWAPQMSRTKFAAMASDELTARRMKQWQLHDEQRWCNWVAGSAPEKALANDKNLTEMDQLLLINAFRPDRLTDLFHSIILNHLKLDTLVPVISLEDIISHGKSTEPIIFITSRGADPSMEVQDAALRLVGKEHFTQIALGGGQTDDAILHLRRCAVQGEWLFFKNLHLVLDWATVLEKELCALPKTNPGFRLIITTEPHECFPTVLLRMSRKVSIEAPLGIKQNLYHTYTTWDELFFQNKTETTSQILFGLAWFHAILQERRSYLPQGWVKFYEFSLVDLKSAADLLCVLAHNKIDWTTVRGLLQDCIYGGRLDNTHDERVLNIFITKIFNDETLIRCTANLSDSITVPATNVHKSILQFIHDHLPDSDAPSILSLPDNADRAVKEHLAMCLTEDLRSFANLAKAGVLTTEAWRALLVPVLELWKSSSLESEVSDVNSLFNNDNRNDPMFAFFLGELELLLDIFHNISEVFCGLSHVVDGRPIPSAELRQEARELIGGRVPSRWLDLMEGPKEVKLWLALLRKRLKKMKVCVKTPFSSTTAPFDLTDFLRPQTFLNAFRVYTARTVNVSLVDLKLFAAPSSCAKNSFNVSVSIKGDSMHLQGAVLDSYETVTLASASSPSSTPLLCDVLVGWVSSIDASKYDSGMVRIPLYTSAERTTEIMELSFLPKAVSTETLLLAGVAAFLVPV